MNTLTTNTHPIRSCIAGMLLSLCASTYAASTTATAQLQPEKSATSLVAADNTTQPAQLIEQIDGVYKKRFANGLVDGTSYTSENILEIVRIAEDAVYFKTHLEFYNGHSCAQNGVARFSGAGVFVFYAERDSSTDQQCRLQLEVSDKRVTIKDPDHSCQEYCGMRGSFDGATFERGARRPIRYMTLLKNSAEYKAAIKALETLENSDAP